MKHILFIGHQDARMFLRDPGAYVWLFVLPTMIMLMMGFMLRGPSGPNVARPSVRIENQDTGHLGSVLVHEMGRQGLRVVEGEGAASCEVVIPEDFTARVIAKERVNLVFAKTAGGDEAAAVLVEARLFRALAALNGRLVEAAMQGGDAPLSEASLQALDERRDPVTVESRFAGHKPRPVGFAFSLPGNLVVYLMVNLLIFGGSSIAEQRATGMLRRVVVSPVRKIELIFGKIYGLMLLGGAQVVVFLALGCVLPGVNLADGFGGILLTLLVFAWVAASLGVLAGSVLKAEDRIVGICLMAGLAMGALGGCWWPLDIAWPPLRAAAHLVPTGWAMDALHQLITFGGGLAAAAPAIGVVALFGLAANIAAVRFFRV